MQGKTNMMRALADSAVLMNLTVSLELNPLPSGDTPSSESYISFNGIDRTSIGDNRIHFFENIVDSSKWVINIEQAYLTDKSDAFNFYKKNRETRKCPGVIATASETIHLPKEDFESLVQIFKDKDSTVGFNNQGLLMSKRRCDEIDLEPMKFQFDSNFIF